MSNIKLIDIYKLGVIVTKEEYLAKVRSIMRFLEPKLRPLKNNEFSAFELNEYFERFYQLRVGIKKDFKGTFDDLVDRDLPPTTTSDEDSIEYISRSYLEQLYEDCRYVMDLLEANSVNHSLVPVAKAEISREIFVSHASKDMLLVQLFVERLLRLGLDISADKIFCTSLDGMNIQNGEDFREQIRIALNNARIVIVIVTPNYKSSEVCLNEMGAAWSSDKKVIPIIVEPINYKSVGVLMEPLQIPKISDPKALSRIKDDISNSLKLSFSKTDLWDMGKESFLADLPSVLSKIEFTRAKTPNEIAEIEDENLRLKEQIAKAGANYIQLTNKYEALKISKNPEAIQEVESRFEDSGLLERFDGLTQDVRFALDRISPIVQAVFLCDFFKLPYDMPSSEYSRDLKAAERKKQLYFDGEDLCVVYDNKDIKKSSDSIKILQSFLKKNEDDLISIYEKKYESPLEPNNEDFWSEHFGLKVPN